MSFTTRLDVIAACWGDCRDEGIHATARAVRDLEQIGHEWRVLERDIISVCRGWREGTLNNQEMGAWLDHLVTVASERERREAA